jgi:hypothetical protein
LSQVKAAASKYLITAAPAVGVAAMPSAPAGLVGAGADKATSPGGLILPGSAAARPPAQQQQRQQQPDAAKSLII